MSENTTRFALYISSDVPQQELWDLNDQINQIEGVKADLREEKAGIVETVMMIVSVIGPVLTVVESAKSVYELAKLLYEFTHSKEEKHNVTISKNGTKVEIKDMSVEDIKKLISEM
jgi:hypothetical protein